MAHVPVFAFLAFSSILYFSFFPERGRLRFFFWFWILFPLWVLKSTPFAELGYFLVILHALVLFALGSIIDFRVKNRFAVLGILNVTAVLSASLAFFYIGSGTGLAAVALFFVFTPIFHEFLNFHGLFPKRQLLAGSAVISLIAVEVFWILGFLPLGFLNSAVFLTLLLLVLRDVLVVHYRGFLDANFMFKELVIFVLIGVLAFAGAKWSLV